MRFMFLCSIAAALALVSTGGCDSCNPDPPSGSASINWSITALGGPATCARAGAVSVSLALRPRGGEELHFAFPCADAQGTTKPVTAGPYDATLTLQDADGATLAIGPTQRAVAIGVGHVITLTPVTFLVEGGKLVLSLATIRTSTNCLLREQGGAGISGTTITLDRGAGGCAPVTFVRSRGSTTRGTYTVNCSAPTVAPCIERDETLTTEGIESGPYVIRVGGLTGAVQCWTSADIVSVPAGSSLVKRIELEPNPRVGC